MSSGSSEASTTGAKVGVTTTGIGDFLIGLRMALKMSLLPSKATMWRQVP